MRSLAPIALFVYNRLDTLRLTIEALRLNTLASDSDLVIFSDGAKSTESQQHVDKVRAFVKTIEGFKSVSIIERENNFGLANSVIAGVSMVVETYGKVIVMEDDLITSQYFLQYMNDALWLYEHEPDVVCIHGYVYPVRRPLPETFFLRGADCWGWGTWKRGWSVFEKDPAKLLREVREKKLEHDLDFDGMQPFTQMLLNQRNGRIDSWAIRWHVSAFLRNKLTLYPSRSLVNNIGEGKEATHTRSLAQYQNTVSNTPVPVGRIAVQENNGAREAYVEFYKNIRPPVVIRVMKRIKISIINLYYELFPPRSGTL